MESQDVDQHTDAVISLSQVPPSPQNAVDFTEAFRSILFPPGFEACRNELIEEPAFFRDLNLDQVIPAIIAKRDEAALRPFFYSSYRNEAIVCYRQFVFRDLERSDVLSSVSDFCADMAKVRLDIKYSNEIRYICHRQMVVIRAIDLYCKTIARFALSLTTLDLKSRGLINLRRYFGDYTASASFITLAADTNSLQARLSAIRYGMLFRGDRVTVRKYADEPDYSEKVLERFERFNDGNMTPAKPPSSDEHSLNHIEEGVLEFVGRLFPDVFQQLGAYVARNGGFIDRTVATFDSEVGFYVSYLSYISRIRGTGLPFCYPAVSSSDKAVCAERSFDLALAVKLLGEKTAVVSNDFYLDGVERMIVVSGPNQGGKTTFARMFGQLHFLAALGCPVPGRQARLFLADRLFTHFEREENIANLRGKLEDELVRLHETCREMTSDSIVILNEIFNSTSLEDQVFLSREILERLLAVDTLSVCVTFVDALASLSEKTVSMVSTVRQDDPAVRTLEIVRKPADGLAYALSLAEKRGVTYERLRERILP